MTLPGRDIPDEQLKNAQPTRPEFQSISLKPQGTNWYLPVAGMRSAPGDRSQGGNWAEGSFGYQKPISKGGHIHEGVDIYADAGTAIVSPVAGTITSAGYNKTSGHYVRMRGVDGIDYFFAHMQASSPWKAGTNVQSGIYVGAVGQSGNAAGTSPHLHFSMRKNGYAVKPNDFLRTGQQQQTTPLSAIPGLNTPEEIQAWAKQEAERLAAANSAMQAGGFDAGSIPGMIADGQKVPDRGFGQQFLSATLDAFSKSLAGGQRTPIEGLAPDTDMSTALSGVGGEGATMGSSGDVPTEKAVHPALQRQDVETN
jgi:hypothetical protein